MSLVTFHDLLAERLPQAAQRTALIERDERLTYEELARQSDALAGQLAELGVTSGDRVALHLKPYIPQAIASFAAARVGAVFVNIHYQWTTEQLLHVVGDSGARVLITDARVATALAEHTIPSTLEGTIVHGGGDHLPDTVPWGAATAKLPAAPGADSDLAAILYTSGSTGQPKGVMLSHANIIAGARSVATYLDNTADDRLLGVLPLCFDYGLNQLTTMMLCGGAVVAQTVGMASEIVKTIIEHDVTGFAGVPPIFVDVVRYLEAEPMPLESLRYVTNSGGAIPSAVLEKMPQVFGNADIVLMYGFTEAFRSTYLPADEFAKKMGSMGRDVPDARTFVIHPEVGICGPGQEGELVHQGSFVSLGYWGRPEDTQKKFRPCPELAGELGEEVVAYSGDTVSIDDDGYYWFVERRDNMIKSSGFRISPSEVEEILYRHEAVGEAVAFGVKDDRVGQVVHVAVSLTTGHECTEAELLAYCRAHLPNYMLPREFVIWAESMPRTVSAKLDRPAIVRASTGRSTT